jgi:hypothetical protein
MGDRLKIRQVYIFIVPFRTVFNYKVLLNILLLFFLGNRLSQTKSSLLPVDFVPKRELLLINF